MQLLGIVFGGRFAAPRKRSGIGRAPLLSPRASSRVASASPSETSSPAIPHRISQRLAKFRVDDSLQSALPPATPAGRPPQSSPTARRRVRPRLSPGRMMASAAGGGGGGGGMFPPDSRPLRRVEVPTRQLDDNDSPSLKSPTAKSPRGPPGALCPALKNVHVLAACDAVVVSDQAKAFVDMLASGFRPDLKTIMRHRVRRVLNAALPVVSAARDGVLPVLFSLRRRRCWSGARWTRLRSPAALVASV